MSGLDLLTALEGGIHHMEKQVCCTYNCTSGKGDSKSCKIFELIHV